MIARTDAFGQTVVVEDVERALIEGCRRGHAEVIEFTVAPRCSSPEEPRGGHEWIIEFAEPPRAPEAFVRGIDEGLQRLNSDYRTKRTGDVGMLPPRVLEVPAGTFYRWTRERGTRGDRQKVPRVTNDRAIAESVLAAVSAHSREPLITVG